MRVSLASALLLGLTLVAAESRGNGPPFLLGTTGCGELDEREMRRLVAAELGAMQVEQRGPGVTLVSVHCGGLRVVIRVDDPLSKKTVQRAFDTGPMDHRARARWIALAASELVLSSWVELETNPAPQVQPEGPAVPAPVRRAAQAAVRRLTPSPPVSLAGKAARRTLTPSAPVRREPPPASGTGRLPPGGYAEIKARDEPEAPARTTGEPDHERSFRAVALGSVRTFLDEDGTLWGGGMRFSEERFRHMSWSADFLFEAGTIDTAKADYRVRSGSAGGWLMLYTRHKVITARVGAGLRLGFAASLAENESSNYDGAHKSGAVATWGWPLAATSLTMASGPMVAELAFEGGYVVLPVGGSKGPSVAGGWFSAQFGLGIRHQAIAPSSKRAR